MLDQIIGVRLLGCRISCRQTSGFLDAQLSVSRLIFLVSLTASSLDNAMKIGLVAAKRLKNTERAALFTGRMPASHPKALLLVEHAT